MAPALWLALNRQGQLRLRTEYALQEANKAVDKFAARESQRVFVGWFLLLGGVYKCDVLIVDLDEFAIAPPGTTFSVYRVKKIRVPEIGTAFSLRVAHLEARQRMLADIVDFMTWRSTLLA